MVERTATGAVLSQSCCDSLSRADATRSTGHRATAARHVLHHAQCGSRCLQARLAYVPTARSRHEGDSDAVTLGGR